MGLVLYDSSDSIPGPDKCSGDHNHSHDHDGYCIGIIDYPYQNRTHPSHAAQMHNRHAPSAKHSLQSSRRTHGAHANKHHPTPHASYPSTDAPGQRRRGRSQGSPALPGSARVPSAPFVPPALMRQDAFCAGRLSDLHQMGVLDEPALNPNQSAHPQEIAYAEPVTMTVYGLDDTSTQGPTDSSYASQARQNYHAMYDGYHDKGSSWQ